MERDILLDELWFSQKSLQNHKMLIRVGASFLSAGILHTFVILSPTLACRAATLVYQDGQ